MNQGPDDFQPTQGASIEQGFLTELPQVAARIERLWNNEASGDETSALREAVHRLAGNAFSLGYGRIGNAARLLESALATPARPGQRPPAEMLTLLLEELRTPVAPAAGSTDEAAQATAAPQIRDNQADPMSLQKTRGTGLVYLVEDDIGQAKFLVAQLERFGYRLRHFTHPDQLGAAVAAAKPAAILMDMMFPESDDLAGAEALQRIQADHDHSLAVLFLSVRDDMAARLQAVRAGAKCYFVKPVDVGELVDALDRVVVQEPEDRPRVLIVDDSAVHARVNALHLYRAGMFTRLATDPHQVLEVLDDFAADLLLIDLYMPECTGVELARAIRQIPAHLSLPIVYLSAESDREAQLRAMDIAGDDFLTKPVVPEHLVSAVQSRVVRYRELQSLMKRDSLTGLLNHTSLRESLAQELKQASRSGSALTVAMVDVDHFKQVNDVHGHVAGDRVLRSLGHLLTRRLRQTDIVARYGGEEFFVVLPRTEAAVAATLMNNLRDAFHAIQHLGNGEEFRVSFSVGIAQFDGAEPMTDLVDRADQALYRAKADGRNRLAHADAAGPASW